MPGEIIVSLIGLAPLVLAWTGIRMWLRERRNRRRKGEPSEASANFTTGERSNLY